MAGNSPSNAKLAQQIATLTAVMTNLANAIAGNQAPPALVGNVGVVSCRGTPPNDMSFADMQACLGIVGNVVPACRQILSSGPCQTT